MYDFHKSQIAVKASYYRLLIYPERFTENYRRNRFYEVQIVVVVKEKIVVN